MRYVLLISVVLTTSLVTAQESYLHAQFRREGERVTDACGTFGFKSIPGCAYTLFTDHPLHIAVGNIAPQNGFGVGGAFVTNYTPNNNWRLSWDVDAVGSTNASWRAGAYMKIIHTPVKNIRVITPTTGATSDNRTKTKKPTVAVRPYTVFNLYAQSISLNKLFFFGLGPSSSEAARSVFGMSQTIVGGSAIKQLGTKLNLSLLGEINGRFVSIRGNHNESSPSIEQLFTEASAPGLRTQPGVVQLGEGVRIKPAFFDNRLELNYLGTFQQYFAPSNSHYSFMRWTVDLGHNFLLYQQTRPVLARDTNGPDECFTSPGAEKCPPVAVSRNLSGSIGVRFLLSESINSATSVVPFYFQPTLGGSDVNGTPTLSSFQDYRFRGPNILLLRESFEHSIWGPFGFEFMADQGTVALNRGDLGFDHLKHSFGTGFTIRAGGFPQIFLLYAWGGGEGNHTTFNMNTTLLGGSYRPSLY
jgi:hypothetical protein